MKRLLIILALLVLVCFNQLTAQTTGNKIPAYPNPNGVSAPFAGFIGDWLVVYGGCNFPDVPAAQGGTKVYYAEGYALNTAETDAQWMKLPDLPEPVAYGATVSTGNKLYCLGGMNSKSGLKNVYEIRLDTLTKQFSVHQCTRLPVSIDNASATTDGQFLYISGGNQGNNDQALYAYPTQGKGKWIKLADYPGPTRIQPALTSLPGYLFLAGGYQYDKQSGCVLSADMLPYNLKTHKWEAPISLPTDKNSNIRTLTGGAGVTLNDNAVLFTGGVNYAIFKAALEGNAGQDYLTHEPEWYQFNNDGLIWNASAKTWQVIPGMKGMEKAGGVLLIHKTMLYMICGEIKPGIRTSEIVTYPIETTNPQP